MGQTTKFKLPWPEMNQSSDGPGAFRRLAEATEAALTSVDSAPGIMRHRAATFNMPSDAEVSPITLDTLTYSTGTWTWPQYGHPALPITGRWLIIGYIAFYPNTNGARCLSLSINGGALSGGGVVVDGIAGHSGIVNVVAARRLGAGTRVGLYGWQSSGVTLACTEAHLSINWLGE